MYIVCPAISSIMVHFTTQYPYVPSVESRADLVMATMLFGFFLGFGSFAAYHVIQETRRTRRWSVYVVLCWLTLISSFCFSLISWLFLDGIIPHGFWIYFWILVFWAIQTNCLFQIIVNRLCVLIPDMKKRFQLRLYVALVCVAINIAVFVVWIPDRLQISTNWHKINGIWDRIEKCLFLVIDAYLNWSFIRTVETRLVSYGLTKYSRLLRFTKSIIFISLALDILIIGLMFLQNDFVYVQFQSLAYLIKLDIEIATSRLIIKVAHSTGICDMDEPLDENTSRSHSRHRSTTNVPLEVSIHTQVMSRQDDCRKNHELKEDKLWRKDLTQSHSDVEHEVDLKPPPISGSPV